MIIETPRSGALPTSDQGQGPPDGVERRRPGRLAHASPELIGLMRGATLTDSDLLQAERPRQPAYDPPPMLGLAVSVVISIPLWWLLGLLFHSLIR